MTTEGPTPTPRVLKYRVTFRTWRKERCHWMNWLKLEHQNYADPKFDPQRATSAGMNMHDDAMERDGCAENGWWFLQVLQYVKRADQLGLTTDAGRQQLVKGLAAYTGMVESAVRVYGPLPEPGHTSGEVIVSQDWAPVEARY